MSSDEINYKTPIETISQLPCNIEAEQVLLGAMLRDNKVCDAVEDIINVEVFYEEIHRSIFEQILKINRRGIIANEVNLKMFFDNYESLNEFGGIEYLKKISAKAASIFDITSVAKIVFDAYLRRCIIDIARNMCNRAYNYDFDNSAEQQIEESSQRLFLLASKGHFDKSSQTLSNLLEKVKKKIEFAKNNSGIAHGATTGFNDLDQLLGGLQNSDLIILAARPSMGKTALALNMAVNIAKDFLKSEKRYIGFFSLEMSAEQLTSRIISLESEINSYKTLTGKINDNELRQILQTSSEIANLPLIIDDCSSLTISSLRTRIRRMHQIYNLGAVFIDYLQLIKGTTRRSTENRVQEVSEVTRGLKAIAKELELPVVALSQLSRLVEQRDDKKPQLSDLRDSGTIEQDADIVMFLYREAYYELRKQPPEGTVKHSEWQAKMDEITNMADILVSKQRNGPIGNIKLFFDSKKGKFANFTSKYNSM